MRVLFVDDEPNVLQGLQRMLRRHRADWTMRFVESARDALDILRKDPHDVVVSDVRMPAMDGVEFLLEVQARHPEVIRVILSGHAGEDAMLRAVGPAHQYLSKPCDADNLVATIRRAQALRHTFRNPNLQRLVTRMESLPSPPAVYREIMAELRSEDPSIHRIADIVAGDVAMSAKVLQLVNSAFFGLPNRIQDTTRAVVHLGLDTVRALALCTGAFSEADAAASGGVSLEALLEHSTEVAGLAKGIGESEGVSRDVRDACFQAGFLHDIGKLVLASSLPQEYAEVVARSERESRPMNEVEAEVFGTTHAEVGGYLLGVWGLPDAVVEAVMFHHAPSTFGGGRFSPLVAVHVADVLHRARTAPDVVTRGLDGAVFAGDDQRLATWRSVGDRLRGDGRR